MSASAPGLARANEAASASRALRVLLVETSAPNPILVSVSISSDLKKTCVIPLLMLLLVLHMLAMYCSPLLTQAHLEGRVLILFPRHAHV